MSYSWFIARRYFKARRRSRLLSFITTFTIAGIALGTSALIITLSILAGFEREIKDKVVGFTSHITVDGYQAALLPNYRATLKTLRLYTPNIKAAAPFVAREGMIRSRGGVDGVFIKGIIPSADISLARTLLVSGRGLADSSSSPELVIGRKLATKLSVSVGDNVALFGIPRAAGQSIQPRAMSARVVGVYESGMAEFDDIYAYTNLYDAQKLFQTGDAVTGYDLLVNDLSIIDQTAYTVQHSLGYPHYARTVFQTYHNLFSWVELQKRLSPVMLGLIIIVAVVNIIGTILMFVLEKSGAIGVLKTLGAGPAGIRRLFIIQGMIISLAGIVIGNLLALALCWIEMRFHLFPLPSDIYYMTSVPIVLRPMNFVVVSFASALLSMITTLLPAHAAARLDPVQLLRFSS